MSPTVRLGRGPGQSAATVDSRPADEPRRAPRGQARRDLRRLRRRRQDDDLGRARDGPGGRRAARRGRDDRPGAGGWPTRSASRSWATSRALVDPSGFAGHGIEMRGELWAMMLDAKRTFDELIERLAPDERTRDEVLANRIYQQLSGAVAGSQEFTAVAKLYELDRSGRFDVLVLDTPPSRNALDFLDAPDRLTGFFEGRALSVFLAPTGLAAKVMGRGTGVVFRVLKRVTGVDLLEDLSVFFRALGGLIDGFRERAERREGAARRPGDDVPDRHLARARAGRGGDLLPRQAARGAGCRFGGLIVNRVHAAGAGDTRPRTRSSAELRRAARRRAGGEGRADLRRGAGARRARRARRSSTCCERARRARPGRSSPSSTATCTTSTASSPSTATSSAAVEVTGRRGSAPAGWRASERVGDRAQVGVEVAAEDVAQQRAQVPGSSATSALDAAVGRRAGPATIARSSDAAWATRAVSAARSLRRRAQRRDAAGQAAAAAAPRARAARAARAGGRSAPRPALGALAAQLEAAQRPGELARRAACGARRGCRRRAARPPARRRAARRRRGGRVGPSANGCHGPAAGARPGQRAERDAGRVVEAQRGEQAAQAHARVRQRRRVAGRRLPAQARRARAARRRRRPTGPRRARRGERVAAREREPVGRARPRASRSQAEQRRRRPTVSARPSSSDRLELLVRARRGARGASSKSVESSKTRARKARSAASARSRGVARRARSPRARR